MDILLVVYTVKYANSSKYSFHHNHNKFKALPVNNNYPIKCRFLDGDLAQQIANTRRNKSNSHQHLKFNTGNSITAMTIAKMFTCAFNISCMLMATITSSQ